MNINSNNFILKPKNDYVFKKIFGDYNPERVKFLNSQDFDDEIEEGIKLINELKAYAAKFGATATDSGYYPAWEYLENSYLRQVMVDCFEQQFGKKPIVAAIHAGLECGLLSEKLNGLDAVSFGPDMVGIHTPNEKLSISSTQRSYKYLCKVLENL